VERAVCQPGRQGMLRERPKRELSSLLLDEWMRDVGEDKSEKIKWPAEQKGVE
jgi:hypothetical protein